MPINGEQAWTLYLSISRFDNCETHTNTHACMCMPLVPQDKAALNPDEVALLSLLETQGDKLSIRRQCLGTDRHGNRCAQGKTLASRTVLVKGYSMHTVVEKYLT
jgi:hypothetical protein